MSLQSPTITAPAAPIVRRDRIFYGWIVVVATFTVLFIAYGIQFSFGVFMHYISVDTGWDRGSLSLPYSLYVFVYSALGFASGRLTDRYGLRRVLTIGGCLLGCGVMLTGSAHVLWQLYIALGLVAACGMSAAYVPCNATVVRWFTIRRGLALGLTSSGTSLECSFFRRSRRPLIAVCGWRHAYSISSLHLRGDEAAIWERRGFVSRLLVEGLRSAISKPCNEPIQNVARHRFHGVVIEARRQRLLLVLSAAVTCKRDQHDML